MDFYKDLKGTAKSQIKNVVEATDGIIDLVTDSEVLEEIPLVKYGVAICNVKDAYRQTRLKRNIASFIEAVSSGDQERLEQCICDLEALEDKGLDVADTMMSLFIDGEKPYKCEIMGNLLLALSEGDIDPDIYQSILQVVLSSSVPALKAIDEWFVATSGEPYAMPSDNEDVEYKNLPFLMSVGISIHRGDEIFVSDLGKKLYDYGLKPSHNKRVN